MIEVLCYHVECFVRSVPDHEEVSSVREGENGGLHVCGAKLNFVEVGESEVVA